MLRLAKSPIVVQVRHEKSRKRDEREREEKVEVEEEVGKVVVPWGCAVEVGSAFGEEIVGEDVERGEGGAAVRPRVYKIDRDLPVSRGSAKLDSL